ncbi:hypothetical protein HY478_03800 [Candidatus Uhrbacteria bacterium]|nr:hypothetical protein [Candidatus Uhrbacteria bacterium]
MSRPDGDSSEPKKTLFWAGGSRTAPPPPETPGGHTREWTGGAPKAILAAPQGAPRKLIPPVYRFRGGSARLEPERSPILTPLIALAGSLIVVGLVLGYFLVFTR